MKISFNPSLAPVNNIKGSYQSRTNTVQKPDSFEFSRTPSVNLDYKLSQSGNTIRLVSFKALQDPTIVKNPSIRAGVGDSENYQENILKTKDLPRGEKLTIEALGKDSGEYSSVRISTKDGDVLGHLPASIDNAIGREIQENPADFSFKLYGTTPASKNNPANVLIDIEYVGDKKPVVQERLNTLLYKNSVTPEQVLHRILDYKKVLHGDEIGTQKIQETQKTIDTIVSALNDPKNQKILLIGHNKPDGDTVGSCMGLKSALDYMGKQQVDVAIDDVLAGFLRNVVDANEIKKSPQFLKEMNSGIDNKMAKMLGEADTVEEISELYSLAKVKEFYNDNVKTLKPGEKYDLAIFLDVPTPTKVSPAIKEYAKNAKNIIYIDHHPFQKSEWAKEKINGGIDSDALKDKNMMLVEHKVPANTMLVTILVDKLLPGLTSKFRDSYYKDDISKKEKDLIEKMSTSLVVGTLTDTSGFRRNINKGVEDDALPPFKKTGFAPAGLSDWLLNLTNGTVTRRSIKKQMKYDLPNKANFYFPQDFVDFYNTEKASDEVLNTSLPSAEEIMAKNTDENYEKIAADVAQNTSVFPDLGLGISKVHFDSMKKYLNKYNLNNPEINMRDIIGAYKYNPTTIALKYPSKDSKYQVAPKYENNKISVMIREEEVAGELNANFQLAKQNSLGFSFRSQEGTNYAGLLATLFGGGGHPSASGAGLSLPGLTAESKLSIKLDGKIETDMAKIHEALENNYEVNYFNSPKPSAKIELFIDDNGVKIENLISDLTTQIRQNP